jgi:hypothetical protein
MKRFLFFIALAPLFVGFSPPASAQVNAASCSNTDVQNAINSASAGQTVTVPAGSCSWTNVTLNKAITLNGSGQGVTTISLDGGGSGIWTITKQTGGVTRIHNFTFTVTLNMMAPHAVVVNGPWPTGEPVIFENDTITLNASDFMTAETAGGVIFSHITFNGTWGSTLYTGKDVGGTASWTTTDSLGTNDTDGFHNSYIEDVTFNGGTITDCDDACRLVVRHNTGNDSGGFNSHGDDSSPQGMRHFEIYDNAFLLPDISCPGGSNTSPSNINQYIWIRGGTGVIFNNSFVHLSTSCWGVKPEIKLADRGAEDDRPLSISCGSTTYPTTHQIGQNNNGTADFTDPIWFWGNTGTVVSVSSGWAWGNPCAFNWNTFFQWGRDAINTTVGSPTLPSVGGSVSGLGGTAKPGYTAFAYPHPLVSSALTLTVTPNPVAFGSQNTGTTSASAATVTVTNPGTSSAILGSSTFFTFTGTNPLEFPKTGGTCTLGQTLAPAATCTVLLKFSPAAAGARSARLNILGSATGFTDLTGTGVVPGGLGGGTVNKVNAATELKNQVPVPNGGLGLSTVANHQTPVGTGMNVYTLQTIPDCQDTAGNHLNFAQSTNTYFCGNTVGAIPPIPFTDIGPVTADDGKILIFNPDRAVTLTRISCGVLGSTSVIINLVAGGNSLIADTTCTAGDANHVVVTTWANGSGQCGGTSSCVIAAHTPITLHIGTISGTPDSLNGSLELK